MITQEMNDLLSRVGPGTRMGNLLRWYWHPIAAMADLEKEPVQPVRLLGEDLTLFRTERGDLGLVAERCAHRGISLAYGIPQVNGLRCAYHGWTYDVEGHIVDMPFEPACLPLKIKAYPVQAFADLVWAYLGPEPAPLLPRWDLLVREDLNKEIRITSLPCNWLQCVDNTLDPAHFEHLHGVYGNYVMKRLGRPRMLNAARTLKIDFDIFEFGVYKRRLTEGEPEDSTDWTVGHPAVFPYILAVSSDETKNGLVYRVPTDDTTTLSVILTTQELKPDETPRGTTPVVHDPLLYDELGRVVAHHIGRQDEMAFIGQGPIADRTAEHLGTSDKGLLLYRDLLIENIERIERGEDPMGAIRDPAVNYPMIQIARRTMRAAFHEGIEEPYWGGLNKATTLSH